MIYRTFALFITTVLLGVAAACTPAKKAPAPVPAEVQAYLQEDPEYTGSCNFTPDGSACFQVYSPTDSKDTRLDGYAYLTVLGTRGCDPIGTDNSGTLCNRKAATSICESKWFQPDGSPAGTKVRVKIYFRSTLTAKDRKQLREVCEQSELWKNAKYRVL